MKKLLLKILTLGLIIIALNNFLFNFFHLPFSWGYYYEKERCLEANPGYYNTILLGSSHVARQIDPALFDSLNAAGHQNSRSINLGMDAMSIAEAYYQFKHIIQQKDLHARYILVDMCGIDWFPYEHLHTTRKKYYYDKEVYYNSVATLMESSYPITAKVRGTVFHTLNFIENALRFNELPDVVKFKKDLKASCNCNGLYQPFIIKENDTSTLEINGTRKLNPHAYLLKNASLLDENIKSTTLLLNSKPEDAGPLDQRYLTLVNDMIAMGREHSAQVIFILAPKHSEEDYRTLIPVLASLKPENKINLANPITYPEFYDMNYTYNIDHLDKSGSAIYTSKLSGQFLKIAGSDPGLK